MNEHPLRNAPLHVWKPYNTTSYINNAPFIARFAPYSTWLIFFEGSTYEEVVSKAEAWRSETVAKHESAYLARLKAREAAKAKAKAKAAQ